MVVIIVLILYDSSSRLSNGETESVKTMVVHEDGDDASSTPCKDSTLVVRQVIHTCMKLKKLFGQNLCHYEIYVVKAYVTTYTECFHSFI